MFVHFFNIITYTVLATVQRVLGLMKDKQPKESLDYYRYSFFYLILILTANLFQLYVDCFALYLILSFTKERRNGIE